MHMHIAQLKCLAGSKLITLFTQFRDELSTALKEFELIVAPVA